jgi:7-cyano-7-deazaguanine reductase
MTGQPDFATFRVRYVPDQSILELKSIKLYVWSYRNEGAFHEDVTNRLLDDFVSAARPRWMEVVGDWNVRGGIKTVIRAAHGKRPEL